MSQNDAKPPFATPIIPGKDTNETTQQAASRFLTELKTPIGELDTTKTPETCSAYAERAKWMISLVVRDLGEYSHSALVGWLRAKREFIRPSTFRQYRSAIIYYWQESGEVPPSEELTMAVSMLQALTPVPSGKRIRRTSSKKRKFIREEEIDLLLARLRASRGKWSPIAAQYLRAALETGMRPGEWGDVYVTEEDHTGILISIKNGKNTNYRATGERREMLIPSENGGAAVVKEFLTSIHRLMESEIEYHKIQGSIARALRFASLSVFGREINISPYSTRHQFSANAKNLYSKEEVAVLKGHRSIETSGNHYGKRTSGHMRFRIAFENRKNAIAPISKTN